MVTGHANEEHERCTSRPLSSIRAVSPVEVAGWRVRGFGDEGRRHCAPSRALGRTVGRCIKVADRENGRPVGEMIPVTVEIANTGNVHATDINIVLCQDETEENLLNNICSEENIAYRQVIGAIMPPDDSGTSESVPITLLFPVTAGNHDVHVIVDPGNLIIEANENNNRKHLGELSSENGWLDVAFEVAGEWSVPTMILLLTIALMAVAGMVMIARRREALEKVAAQSSMLSIDDELRF